MRGRVIEHDGAAPDRVDARFETIADLDLTAGHAPDVRVHPAELLRVDDLELGGAVDQRAGAADLAAALRVEGRVVEDYPALRAHSQSLAMPLTLEQCDALAVVRQVLVAAERGLALDGNACREVNAELARRATALALRVHRCIETGLIDRQPTLACDVRCEIDGKA